MTSLARTRPRLATPVALILTLAAAPAPAENAYAKALAARFLDCYEQEGGVPTDEDRQLLARHAEGLAALFDKIDDRIDCLVTVKFVTECIDEIGTLTCDELATRLTDVLGSAPPLATLPGLGRGGIHRPREQDPRDPRRVPRDPRRRRRPGPGRPSALPRGLRYTRHEHHLPARQQVHHPAPADDRLPILRSGRRRPRDPRGPDRSPPRPTPGSRPGPPSPMNPTRLILATLLAGALSCDSSSSDGTTDPGPPPPPASCDGIAAVPGTPALTLESVAGSFDDPLLAITAPGDADRIFVVEQGGRIWVVRRGVRVETPFLDVSDRVRSRR